MKVPMELAFRNVEKTDALLDLINKKVAKLERVCGYISSCRIAIERDQLHQDAGNPWRIRIDMTVPPGHELVVRRESSEGYLHDPLPMMIRLAFDAAQKQLKKLTDLQHYEVKSHVELSTVGTIVRLFPEQDYGFLYTTDGRDIYFHRNSVLNGDFDRLIIGTTVRFSESMGEAGPQATTVEIIEKPALREPELSTRTAIPEI
jgi:cold shock CspA family protein/ribosome-associated translation inhibitor RaiA